MPRARHAHLQLLLLLSGVLLFACEDGSSASETGSKNQAQHSVPHSIDLTNISECDSYLAWYEDCIESTLPTWQHEQALAGLRKTRDRWVALGTSGFKKQSTARMCEAALRSARNEFDGDCFGSDGAGDGTSSGGSSSGECTLDSATEMGPPETDFSVPNQACMKLETGYPSWWGNRDMGLQSQGGGTYPVTVAWSNSCAANSGTQVYAKDWDDFNVGPLDSACPTLFSFSSSNPGPITFRYFAR